MNLFTTIQLEANKIIEKHVFLSGENPQRIEAFARKVVRSIPSNKGIKKAVLRGEILVNGLRIETSYWMQDQDQLTVEQNVTDLPTLPADTLEVIFEDDHFAIINKPAGLAAHSNSLDNLVNRLQSSLIPSTEVDALFKISPVHRLDKATSGILVAAKTKTAQVHLSKQFENKEIVKTYLAITRGKMIEKDGQWNFDIENKPAQTIFQQIESFIGRDKVCYNLVQYKPKTGRTHQLRIHSDLSGNPIIGDRVYGDPQKMIKGRGLMLCAKKIKLIHPITRDSMEFEVAFPKRFKKFIRTKKI